MRYVFFDRFWHQTLQRPYKLAVTIDQGQGQPVVLLHGIGSSGQVWRRVAAQLSDKPVHLLAFDLLGFGASPKPEWPQYSVDDHARAVIASIKAARLRRPVVLVGHSMGSLVAVRIARLQPGLVKRLILYEMPLYAGLPDLRRYNVQRNVYLSIYKRIAKHPEPLFSGSQKLRNMVARLTGFEVGAETWPPFVKSLEHTIMQQNTLADIKNLTVPMDVIYGSLDMVVIRGKPKQIFGEIADLTTHTIVQPHAISARASKFIAQRIEAAL
ncbi:MAG TPA: alpha/beta fold hydrolase [Nevskiaceae bacterium]|nr:alpha/beta fold hydrolase [Nevskiaceae bacterium]